jgi:hypothetical protein
MDFDEALEKLNSGTLPPAPREADAPPLDPAEMTRYDRDQAHKLIDRRLALMEAERVRQGEIERHWDRYEGVLDRRERHEAGIQACGSPVGASSYIQTQINYYGVMPAWPQPQFPYSATDTWFAPDQVVLRQDDDRRFMRRVWIGAVMCGLASLAMIWGLAAVFRFQGQQDAQQRAYHASSHTASVQVSKTP